jgi:hypothetical protein
MPISISAAGVAFTENFDTLSNVAGSTTNTALPNGWALTETGGGARDNEQYAVDTGGSTTGDMYSYGAAASTERAFGELRSGTLIPVFGASFTNNTGATITSLLIAYTGEQWRFGGVHATVGDKLDFQISFNATDLTTGTWTDVNALDFLAPITAGTAGALDGNLAANRTAVSSTIPALSIAAGATFWIRWTDTDASAGDDGLAIDDFSLTAITATPSPGALAIADNAVVEGDSGTTQLAFTVTRSGGSAGAVDATWTISFEAGDSASAGDLSVLQALTGTVSFADGQTSKQILVDIAGDTDIEGNETFTVTLSAPTNGATLGDAVATGTITNDDVAPVPGTLSIGDNSVTEGNSGTTQIAFTVTRATGSDGAVGATWTVTFEAGDTADSADLGATLTGTVSFANGETSKQILVDVNGDTAVEGNETFTVTLSAPTGGVTITDAVAVGTITNDDAVVPVPGTLSIGDSSVVEGNSGTSTITFTVTRSGGDDGAVGASWALVAGGAGAVAASDFPPGQAFTGTVSFADGETSKTIDIQVAGDTIFEGNEAFNLVLTTPTGGASLGDDAALGTILTDDFNVFINEIHYDDAGTDAGEAIEIAGLAGTNLSGWSLVLYNFTGGATYATINLTGLIPNQDDGYGTLSFTAAGLQNGPNDGIALVAPGGIVVQFLSYEGPLTATNGAAAGMTSTDIGVSEEPAVTDGFSLQLVGTGAVYGDFTWAAAKANTFGLVNSGQDFLGTTATGLVSVGNASVAEGQSGTTSLVFTIHRAGGLDQTATVDYAINLDGTADAADIGARRGLRWHRHF